MKGTLLEKRSILSTVSRILFEGFYSKTLILNSLCMPTAMQVLLRLAKMKGTLNAEKVPFRLYFSSHSREFHETPRVIIPAHVLQI